MGCRVPVEIFGAAEVEEEVHGGTELLDEHAIIVYTAVNAKALRDDPCTDVSLYLLCLSTLPSLSLSLSPKQTFRLVPTTYASCVMDFLSLHEAARRLRDGRRRRNIKLKADI